MVTITADDLPEGATEVPAGMFRGWFDITGAPWCPPG